jgi:hypothetical protein
MSGLDEKLLGVMENVARAPGEMSLNLPLYVLVLVGEVRRQRSEREAGTSALVTKLKAETASLQQQLELARAAVERLEGESPSPEKKAEKSPTDVRVCQYDKFGGGWIPISVKKVNPPDPFAGQIGREVTERLCHPPITRLTKEETLALAEKFRAQGGLKNVCVDTRTEDIKADMDLPNGLKEMPAGKPVGVDRQWADMKDYVARLENELQEARKTNLDLISRQNHIGYIKDQAVQDATDTRRLLEEESNVVRRLRTNLDHLTESACRWGQVNELLRNTGWLGTVPGEVVTRELIQKMLDALAEARREKSSYAQREEVGRLKRDLESAGAMIERLSKELLQARTERVTTVNHLEWENDVLAKELKMVREESQKLETMLAGSRREAEAGRRVKEGLEREVQEKREIIERLEETIKNGVYREPHLSARKEAQDRGWLTPSQFLDQHWMKNMLDNLEASRDQETDARQRLTNLRMYGKEVV